MRRIIISLLTCALAGCMQHGNSKQETLDTSLQASTKVVAVSDRTKVETNVDSSEQKLRNYAYGSGRINTGNTSPGELVAFANTLVGVPYKYGSTNPVEGFDCSGFITYVFNHFNIAVPRSSIDFTKVEREVPLSEAKPGDLILFTGTDSTVREVGHMGIIHNTDNNQVSFIHSSSGKAHGVTITPLNEYYMGRFVKVIRVFEQS